MPMERLDGNTIHISIEELGTGCMKTGSFL